MDHATACKHFGLDPDQTSPEQLSQHMAKAGAAYQKAGGHQPPAGAGAEGEGGGEGGDVDPDGDGEPDGGPQGGGAGGAVHVHVHAEGAAVKKTKKTLAAKPAEHESPNSNERREFAAQMAQVGTRLTALETENKQLKADKKTRDHDDLVRELLRGDHIDASQKGEVVEMAAAIGVEKAKLFFSKFKRGLQGQVGLSIDPDGTIEAKTPEQAVKALDGQVVKMVKELNLKEGEAMARVYGAAENNLLVALANSSSRPR
jgi:hypothetical protein